MKIYCREVELEIPDYLMQIETYPEDPPNAVSYGQQTENASNFMLIFPINLNESLPFDSPQIIIDSIHRNMNKNQGLIEVNVGNTKSGKKYVYSIVKTLIESQGVQYALIFQIKSSNSVINIQSYYDETGITGMRDAYVYDLARNTGQVPREFEGWMKDPYDENYTKGIRMNLSEDSKYDKLFPAHPLSILRDFLRYLIQYN